MSKKPDPLRDDAQQEALQSALALADALRGKAQTLRDGDLAARAACFAVPMDPWRPGLDHVSFWPGQLAEFDARMPRADALRLALAYLLLEIERLEKPLEAQAA